MEPEFYTEDTQSEYNHTVVCFAAEVRLRTPSGFVRVDRLNPGDMICIEDGGAQPILWTTHRVACGLGMAAPVRFPEGTLGNSRAIRVSPQHRMLIRTPHAKQLFGNDEVLLPAKSFLASGVGQISRCMDLTYVHLVLDQHHLLCAEGAVSESLFLGQQARRTLSSPHARSTFLSAQDAQGAWQDVQHERPARPLLTVRQGRELLANMDATPRTKAYGAAV